MAGVAPAVGHCSQETANVSPNLPEEEVNVDMMLLARKRPMKWQQGKVSEILRKGKKFQNILKVTYEHQCLDN